MTTITRSEAIDIIDSACFGRHSHSFLVPRKEKNNLYNLRIEVLYGQLLLTIGPTNMLLVATMGKAESITYIIVP